MEAKAACARAVKLPVGASREALTLHSKSYDFARLTSESR
jgi:hypothetical protein